MASILAGWQDSFHRKIQYTSIIIISNEYKNKKIKKQARRSIILHILQ